MPNSPAPTGSAPSPATPSGDTPPRAVKSAKDAINAMYSSSAPQSLSSMLAQTSTDKSASHLHQASTSQSSTVTSSSSPRPTTLYPTASTLLRRAEPHKHKPSLAVRPQSPRQDVAPQPASTPQPSTPKPSTPPQPTISKPPRAPKVITTQPTSAPQPVPTEQSAPAPSVIRKTSIPVTPTPAPAPAALRPTKTPIQLAVDTARAAAAITSIQTAAETVIDQHTPRPPRVTRTATFRSVTTATIAAPRSPQATHPSQATHLPQSTPAPRLSQPTQAPRPSQPIHPPRPTASGRVFQDIVRPVAPAQPRPAVSIEIPEPPAALRPPSRTKRRPFDSIKNRFRPAPKGYANTEEAQARPLKMAEYVNPQHTLATSQHTLAAPQHTLATPQPTPVSQTPAAPRGSVHIYGMSDHPEAFSPTPAWAKPLGSTSRPTDGLGIVEDYRPTQPREVAPDPSVAQAITYHSFTSPDNNRYALTGQSPFFLKSVSVEKRPLSDGRALPIAALPSGEPTTPKEPPVTPEPSRPVPQPHPRPTQKPGAKLKAQSARTKHSPALAEPGTSRPATSPISAKNTYQKRGVKASTGKTSASAPSKRDQVDQPTVIIPASRRSHAPLFFLLAITILLGAAVGALAYLCFFQS